MCDFSAHGQLDASVGYGSRAGPHQSGGTRPCSDGQATEVRLSPLTPPPLIRHWNFQRNLRLFFHE